MPALDQKREEMIRHLVIKEKPHCAGVRESRVEIAHLLGD